MNSQPRTVDRHSLDCQHSLSRMEDKGPPTLPDHTELYSSLRNGSRDKILCGGCTRIVTDSVVGKTQCEEWRGGMEE